MVGCQATGWLYFSIIVSILGKYIRTLHFSLVGHTSKLPKACSHHSPLSMASPFRGHLRGRLLMYYLVEVVGNLM